MGIWLIGSTVGAVLRHALIVGANEGGGTLEPLRYAETDAQKVAEVLVELGSFDPAFVTVLYAPSPTELHAALEAHGAIAGGFDEDLFLFYYSGHADARGLRVGTSSIAYETLRGDIRAIDAEVKLGVLDACRSGTITLLKGAALSAPFLVEDRLAAEGEAWMTAASADEAAQESDQLRGSFFTHYWISGMRGAADTGDGEVSLNEAYAYASERVVAHTGGTEAGVQHPNFDYRLRGQESPSLTKVSLGRATATLPADLEGQVQVLRLPDRTPVAEVAKRRGTPVTLALAPGTYKFRLAQGKEMREAIVGVTDGSRLTVSRWGDVGVEAGTVKGQSLVFDPYTISRWSETGKEWLSARVSTDNLRESPLIAGGLSTIVPGVGQFYNGHWGKGTLLFLGTAAALGGSIGSNDTGFFTGAITGPDYLRMSAAMLWGASIADAAYRAQELEPFRPQKGWTIATHSAWMPTVGWSTPATAGINLEWILPPRGMSVELDRAGWTRSPDGDSTWGAGGRLNLFVDGTRFRPGVFVGVGGRVVDAQSAQTAALLREEEPDILELEARWVTGGGAALRWYITPRYFVQQELRVETDGGPVALAFGGGLGLHLGH